MTYRHAILNRRADLGSVTSQRAATSDMNTCKTEVPFHSKETAGVVEKIVSEENKERRLTRASMRVGGSGTQATRHVQHVQAGSGVAQTTIACATPPSPSITRALDSPRGNEQAS
jgi:hypothetical protein